MDVSQTPGRTLRLLVDICRTPDQRFEGRIRADDSDPWHPFSGVLELLKVVEELLETVSPA